MIIILFIVGIITCYGAYFCLTSEPCPKDEHDPDAVWRQYCADRDARFAKEMEAAALHERIDRLKTRRPAARQIVNA